MNLRTNVVDLWVFHKRDTEPKYLLLQTSQEKADKWFNGSRFWQIPGGFLEEGDELADVMRQWLAEYTLTPKGIWAAEYVSCYYNIRRKNLELTPAFAAQVEVPVDVPLTWHHSEFGWFTVDECKQRLVFRGLLEGLDSVREHVSEVEAPHGALRIL
ncbi:NUDIX domain-containing protein [Candidatus Bipolaricaulota bacterium]|nr:NUDIX domain-containing protein [Candidatus Bipolaricaulota bacterium]